MDNQVRSFVRDLSSTDVYKRKHAAWMIARLAQKGKAVYIADAGAIPPLVKCIDDTEMIVKYRAVWALGLLAKHGQAKHIRTPKTISALEKLTGDRTEVEICHPHTGEMVSTTLGKLAEDALKYIGN